MTTDKNDKTMFAMRISKDEKMQLKGLFQDMGLDLSTAVNLFFKQSLAENGLPFRPSRKRDNKSK
ncbi:type II toxin-antitoxin system RelB/DinJ family antitoxin [Lactiplantibacillus plantarum]|uniref:type II toxin-antitoxin system RelB/DinJ family antitoxin n=1 Tax=Lactiplantibacillus plantarum TaxID=1590 RepID=UPI0010810656|nr:type II toxin-antitoxin system RelB/DinJ family antitoxin [Lactiplantibacillus plantarum]MCT3233433.1 polysaccharide biosynthesis protein [Lactiplantibacillus plantarum]MCT3550402.1 polysaccharide biosynthesis protein [Lactiplantibacillus plantarum]MDN7061360.1 polysaccharide biosynthesis protein [Lactiplantibacillus plantarum]QBX94982.1 polysaccharide biosynthesis protein [Lactiplantibacillus plantarum]